MGKIQKMKNRSDGGGIPVDTAGCPKCDDEMPMVDDVHHSDGSVCVVMKRNYAALERKSLAPLGRYQPSRDRYV